jgi:ATPase subunit of ABC transporter with duplicated ATPase domains
VAPLVDLQQVAVRRVDRVLFEELSLSISDGERVGVVGANGTGKSTLLRIVAGVEAPQEGQVRRGRGARVGFLEQVPVLPPGSVRSAVGEGWEAAAALDRLGLGEVAQADVATLSGGQAKRAALARVLAHPAEVLVLDEPTNHLDLEAIHALVAALRAFEGALIFVSHDRAFVSALATRILEVTEGGFRDFPGTYDEYLSKRGDDHLDADAVVLRAKKQASRAPAGANNGAPSALSREEQKRRRNRQKQLPSLRDAALKAVEEAEGRKAAIHARWSEPGFFERTLKGEIAVLQAEDKALGPRIAALMVQWEALEKEIAESSG